MTVVSPGLRLNVHVPPPLVSVFADQGKEPS
jgi:hypothetical protein